MKEVKQPNRTRKYKVKFYVLFIISIILLSFFVSLFFISDSIIEREKSKLMENKDYYIETLTITNKKKNVDGTGYYYYFMTGYNTGNFSDEYFLYSKDIEIIAEQDVYNDISIGDTIDVYKTKYGIYCTSIDRAKFGSVNIMLTNINFIGFIFSIMGILMIIYLLILRKKMLNPYYKGKDR